MGWAVQNEEETVLSPIGKQQELFFLPNVDSGGGKEGSELSLSHWEVSGLLFLASRSANVNRIS